MSRERSQVVARRLRRTLCTTPEIQLLVPGLSLSLGWEFLQSPFYADTFARPWAEVALNRLHCAGVDAWLLLLAFWLVALGWGRDWPGQRIWRPYALFLVLGVAYRVLSEYRNVYVLQHWAYSPWMPTAYGIGLVPLLQWCVVPILNVQWVRRRWIRQAVEDSKSGLGSPKEVSMPRSP
ncbi:MAG: hypothetical protein AB7N91_07865 [Candidatus Tectimicrobiota bacterium]